MPGVNVGTDERTILSKRIRKEDHESINAENSRRGYLWAFTTSVTMAGFQNRSDLLLLDTGSIMMLVFGALSLLIGTIVGVGLLLGSVSTPLLGTLALSVILAVDGLALILLSRHC
ncbi:hypothetical protein [Halobaculum rarum]|uniref:hypothetical protein n=1 Tax=Halobaculum rarum TaxID=3075122 RepID=UPI0032AE9E80